MLARQLKFDEDQWRGVTMGLSAVGSHWSAGVQNKGCFWTVPDPQEAVVTPKKHNFRPIAECGQPGAIVSRDGRYAVSGSKYFGQEQYWSSLYPAGRMGKGRGRHMPSVKLFTPFPRASMTFADVKDRYAILLGPPHDWNIAGAELAENAKGWGDYRISYAFTHLRSWSNHPRFLTFVVGFHRKDRTLPICELADYPLKRKTDPGPQDPDWPQNDLGDVTWYTFAAEHLNLPNKPDLDLWVTRAPDEAKWLDGASWRNPMAVGEDGVRADAESGPETIVVRARLSETSSFPPPDMTPSYPRTLIDHVWDVIEVRKGRLRAKRVLVSHWLRLDYRMQKRVMELEEGETYTLKLAPMERFARYRKDVRITTVEAADLPGFLDVTVPPPQVDSDPAEAQVDDASVSE